MSQCDIQRAKRTRLILIILGAAMSTSCNPPSAIRTPTEELSREIDELEAQTLRARIQIAEMQAEIVRRNVHVRMMSDRVAQARTMLAKLEITTSAPEPTPDKLWRCVICGRPLDVNEPLRPRHIDGPQNHEAELSYEDLGILADGLRMRD